MSPRITSNCTLVRSRPKLVSNARFQLITAMNLCPSGFYGDTQKPCTCAQAIVTKYQKHISGSLLDRIDIHIKVPRVDYEKLSGNKLSETSDAIRLRVQAVRNIQQTRFMNRDSQTSNIISNADIRVGEIWQFCKLQDEGGVLSLSKHQSLMRAAMSQLNLSARAYRRILKFARTIAISPEVGDILSPFHYFFVQLRCFR